jgi:hypothetical protein
MSTWEQFYAEALRLGTIPRKPTFLDLLSLFDDWQAELKGWRKAA